MNKVFSNKNNIYKILIVLLISLSVFLFIMGRRITNLERIKIDEFNNQVLNYLDYVAESKDEGRYISFALLYLKEEKNKNSFTDDEVLDAINNTFNVKYDIKEMEKIGISKDMVELGITHEVNKYTINNDKTKKDIADSKIIKYNVYDVTKNNRNSFTVKCDRYVVENPYEVLNYYSDSDIDKDDLLNYLNGTGNIKDIKKYIDDKNINKIGKIDGSIKIKYIIDNNKLLIESID